MAQIVIRMDPETKSKLMKLAQAEGKNTSQVVRELIEDYIQSRDIVSYIDDLWERIGKKLKRENLCKDDIRRAIVASRAAKERI